MGQKFTVYWTYDYKVTIKTGDRKHAGTNADVKIRLYDFEGRSTPHYPLDVKFRDDFQRGEIDEFRIDANDVLLGALDRIELSLDPGAKHSEWYVEYVEIFDKRLRKTFIFPVNRWIFPERPLSISHLDCVLPQDDPLIDQRKAELERKRELYEYHVAMEGLPPQVKKIPNDERFSDDAVRDLSLHTAAAMKDLFIIKLLTSSKIGNSFADLEKIYGKLKDVERPLAISYWREDDWFGALRLRGSNAIFIRRCTAIPEKLGVTDVMTKRLLEGLTLQEAVDAKRLYICDYEVLVGIPAHKEGCQMVHPIGLFFVNKTKDLMPVAIQLFQEKATDNPVFLPTDEPNVWLYAKMWFNMADAVVHQAVTHLGLTHVLMESVAVCTHRNLSPSHPIFKLLAPHFFQLFAINESGRKILLSPGGWFDTFMTPGADGARELIVKSLKDWRLNVEGHPIRQLEERGVDDEEALPFYPYREDVKPVFNSIEKYVNNVVNIFYENEAALKADFELQQWAKELSAPHPDGIGIKGVPGCGKFDTIESLKEALTLFIYRCSAAHAAANFYQYEEYAFQPHMPLHIKGEPPRNKEPVSEKDMLRSLADKDTLLFMIAAATVLSFKGTESLGLFEVTYLHHPRALEAAQDLRTELVEIARVIRARNKRRIYPYTVLDPEYIPNAISA